MMHWPSLWCPGLSNLYFPLNIHSSVPEWLLQETAYPYQTHAVHQVFDHDAANYHVHSSLERWIQIR